MIPLRFVSNFVTELYRIIIITYNLESSDKGFAFRRESTSRLSYGLAVLVVERLAGY